MKKTFIALLALTGVVYAAPLSSTDWETDAPENCFIFSDNQLTMGDNTNGYTLYYKGTALPMENGSGLSITFQFETATFLDDVGKPDKSGTQLSIILNGEKDQNGKPEKVHTLSVLNNWKNNPTEPLNIYESLDNAYVHDFSHEMDSDVSITKITVNYIIRDDKLYWNYWINGNNMVEDDICADLELDTTLDWRPSLGVATSEKTVYTVTDVTFIPVPEPTTAALSLLALAGLAARRRR